MKRYISSANKRVMISQHTRKQPTDDNWRDLALAIVQQAVEDYDHYLGGKNINAKRMRSDCERFFLEQWFELLCPNINGQRIINEIQKRRKKCS